MAASKIIDTPHLEVLFRVCPKGEKPSIVGVDWRRVDEALAEWGLAGIPVEPLGLESEPFKVVGHHGQAGTAADIETPGTHSATDG